jgi:hypothetical protein
MLGLRASLACWLVVCAATGARADTPPRAPRDFGSAPTLTEPTPLAELARAPEQFADRDVLVRGKLRDVCQHKGCWTVLQDGDAEVRVRFLDYAFFIPTDSVGADALVQGRVEVVTLSVDEARHYASEGRGGDPESVVEPVRELSMVASGVRLLPRDESEPAE